MELLIAELKGEDVVQPETLDYYARHYFNVAVDDASLKHSTIMGYASAYNAHWREFGYRRIDSIKLSELKEHLKAKPLAQKTRRHVLSVLRLIFDCAVDDEAIPSNPLDSWKIKKDKVAEDYDPDPYTGKERDTLLEWLQAHNEIAWRYFLMGFYTGMRTGELLGAPWDNYDRPVMKVRQEMVRREIRPYTKTKGRELPLPKIVQRMLSDSPTRFKKGLIHLTPNDLMFKDADWLMTWWNKAHDATGIRKRTQPYPWRSTFISQCVSNGIPMSDVARWVGNSPTMIEKHYHKYLPTDDREARLQQQMEDALK